MPCKMHGERSKPTVQNLEGGRRILKKSARQADCLIYRGSRQLPIGNKCASNFNIPCVDLP